MTTPILAEAGDVGAILAAMISTCGLVFVAVVVQGRKTRAQNTDQHGKGQEKIDDLGREIRALHRRLDDVDTGIANLTGTVTTRLTGVETDVGKLEDRVGSVEQRLAVVEHDLNPPRGDNHHEH